jgi:hypothetical protein
MSALAIEPIRHPDLRADARATAGGIELVLAGSCDSTGEDHLAILLPRVHAEATRLGATEVAVDLLALEFMSSSCLKRFVTWIHSVQDATVPYRITFVSSGAHPWQRRSLHALACFAPEVVNIDAR